DKSTRKFRAIQRNHCTGDGHARFQRGGSDSCSSTSCEATDGESARQSSAAGGGLYSRDRMLPPACQFFCGKATRNITTRSLRGKDGLIFPAALRSRPNSDHFCARARVEPIYVGRDDQRAAGGS